MGYRRRTHEEWLELYRKQRASGQTVKDWCAENEIKLPTMVDRITHLRKLGLITDKKPGRGGNSVKHTGKEPAKGNIQERAWVEIAQETAHSTADAAISVLAGSYIVQVQKGFEPGVLRSVCKALVTV